MIRELPPIRRIVCSINAAGRSYVESDGPPPAVRPTLRPGFASRNIWATFGSPSPIRTPSTRVGIAFNSPWISAGASGLGSNVSCAAGAPKR